MTRLARFSAFIFSAVVFVGCGTGEADPVAKSASYQTLAQADEAFEAKKFAEALTGFDQAIRAGVVQPDVLAETYVKRATCKIETGDMDGAAEDLAQAERGGAVGEEYQQVQKMLSQKRSGS